VSRSLPRQPPIKVCPLYLISCPLRLLSSAMCLLLQSLSHPHNFGVTTPVMRPILRVGLHAYLSGRSTNPCGNVKGPPRLKSVELAGPSSIPRKQLLKQLVVVRHRLRHNGKVRRRIKGTSIRPRSCQESNCVRRWCTIIQGLQAQVVRSHADAKF
jgi:hypothetical protein